MTTPSATTPVPHSADGVTLFLAGDVMTGRGIDQILPTSVDPRLFEPWVSSATTYVQLAEEQSGPIPNEVAFDYVWGDALALLAAARPALRIINLETAVTDDGTPWPHKGIHYRMHPANVAALTVAGIDCCTLANNHVIDWGRPGLLETLATLQTAGIATPGAGANLTAATEPAVLPLDDAGRVLVLSLGHPSSGIPPQWAAEVDRSGVWIEELTERAADRVAELLANVRRPGDIVVASVHWGGNWGWAVPAAHQRFGRLLIERAGVDLVHGHSSHHPMGIEVHHDRPILYGCGDFINDYEGITGHEAFRPELRLMYLPRLDPATGALLQLRMVVLESVRLQLRRAEETAVQWMAEQLDRECRTLGSRIEVTTDGELALRWTS